MGVPVHYCVVLTPSEITDAIVNGLGFGALCWSVGLVIWAAFAGFRTVLKVAEGQQPYDRS